jgi:hypothetical protein
MVGERIEIIDNIVSESPNRLRESYIKNNDYSLYQTIIEYTKNLDTPFKQKIWHWVNNEPDYIYCKECSINRVSFNMNWKDGYKSFCSNKCSSNNKELREKSKKTLIEKYGVDHYSKTDEYKDKVKSTSIEKWGVDNYSKTDEYLKKSKETSIEKWGVDNYSKTEEYLEKSKKTCLEKWGVDSYTKTKEYKDKFKKTCLEKYLKDHIFKTENGRSNFKITKDINYIGYEEGFNLFKCQKNHLFKISTDNYYGRTKNNIELCTICYPIGEHNSIKEIELSNYISSLYNGDIINSYRDSFEIDIYLPDLKIGFEFNGLYWHSDKFKNKNYHIDKTNFFKEKGIRIIHIWEDDWDIKGEIIKSQIKNLLKISKTKIWARKCIIKKIDNTTDFLNKNHIQGSDRSNIKIGLFYDGELVSAMTFNKNEGRIKMKEDEWNLSRFCNKLNTNIVGGASKLLNYFIKEFNPNRIISYADLDWSIGHLYFKLGFNKINETGPDYKYIIDNKRKHKQNFTKSKLKILDTNLTESQYTSKINLNKIWDCGKIKFEMKKPS